MMPKMGGAELASRLSSLRPDLRIIFMSGYSDDPIVRTIERSPSIFLPKPFTAAALLEKVRQALGRTLVGPPAGQHRRRRPMKHRLWRYLIAIVVGNAIYFAIEKYLPPRDSISRTTRLGSGGGLLDLPGLLRHRPPHP